MASPCRRTRLQFKWIVVIKEGLEAVFRDDPDVFVAGDLLWYPVEGEPTIRTAPDAMVAFGRPKGRRGSYRQWEEGSIAPQVVFEVLSPGNRPGEMKRKFEFYEKYGVEEYYVYDPDEGTLEGWLRARDHLERIPEMAGFVSPRLGIRFEPGKGPDNLTIIGPDGKPFSDVLGRRSRPDRDCRTPPSRTPQAERQRAESRTRTKRSRTTTRRTISRKLRELGIEPD